MSKHIKSYIKTINERYKLGNASEHSFRGDLEALIKAIVQNIDVTNEPLKVTDCGNPDYVISKGKIPIGFIEAKDIGKDLHSKQFKEQFDRYRAALDNLIITDYITFDFYQNGTLVHTVQIGKILENKICSIDENFFQFTNLIKDFCTFISQTIKSAKKLAELMAGKARLLENTLSNAVSSDEAKLEDTNLKQQYETFKSILIHDLSPNAFADIYAQTLAYGMFAARLHDESLNDFSRHEAAELIPRTNPFLKQLFESVAGANIDERIKTTVDNLADVFRATDVASLLKDFGKQTQSQDPIIHFYETFLAEYNPKLRKSRGVWYTPTPVVNFIVRAVDEILQDDFSLADGLADTSKTTIEINSQTRDGRSKTGYKRIEKEVHKVQVLDPATGTGTFLAETIKYIYSKQFASMQGIWSSYVEEELIPRLNGFELLMASYAMAHLKLDLLLTETGYKPKKQQRFNVFLTNSLEEEHPDTGTLFASWLSSEANAANYVKRDTPVMVVMGNPPYSGESSNKGEWIMRLMEDYKKEPGGKEKLKEKNSKWINDDYVKFLRYGQHFIEKNGEGVLAFINAHGFLDNPTFRGMRWSLLKTYDKIYVIDLHGNAKKKEVAPDGSKDENVFDIQQGVSINLFVKTGKKRENELAKIYSYDLFGLSKDKYKFLEENNLNTIKFEELPNKAPMYFMVKKDFEKEEQYEKGISLKELFPIKNVGIVTARDKFTIHESKKDVTKTIDKFLNLSDEDARQEFKLGKDVRDWKVNFAKQDLLNHYPNDERIVPISYRPFDIRWTFYTGKSKGFHCYPRNEVMKHFIGDKNIGLCLCKQFKSGSTYQHAFISNLMIESSFVSNKTSEITSLFPLYISTDTNQQSLDHVDREKPNLNIEAVKEFVAKLQLSLNVNYRKEKKDGFSPYDLLDYIYAVLYSPKYRDEYKEFLKIDFPKIPMPKNKNIFWGLVKYGNQLRNLHLINTLKEVNIATSYPVDGDNLVARKLTQLSPGFESNDRNKETGKVWINDEQYFDNIPKIAWDFFIGGYQPAQKWLKDRSGSKLVYSDINHYQKIIYVLTETSKIMTQIDEIDFL